MGKIRKIILQDIYAELRIALNTNQCRSTEDRIE